MQAQNTYVEENAFLNLMYFLIWLHCEILPHLNNKKFI